MSMTDPISDMLARIRNGQQAGKKTIKVPASKVKQSVLNVMLEEGYISAVNVATDSKHPELDVELKYVNGKGVISQMSRVSKPGLRVYSAAKEIPMVRNGLGISIVSTSKGVMTDTKAREMNVGGEVLCQVF